MGELVPVTFTTGHGMYVAGDVAGFAPQVAQLLIERKVAAPYDAEAAAKVEAEAKAGAEALAAREAALAEREAALAAREAALAKVEPEGNEAKPAGAPPRQGR